MKVLYFDLGNPGKPPSDILTSWTKELSGISLETPSSPDTWEDAIRAVWRGEPFLIAAEPKFLDRYLARLDADAVEVLRDCAYFWLLTDSSTYVHKHLPGDRLVALDWKNPSQNLVRDALKRLGQFPRLKGLSRVTDKVRRRIAQLAAGQTGPGCSVLILGPTGSGKEEVAQSLVAASNRQEQGMQALSGAWLKMEPGMAMSELVGLERGRLEERIPGLLKQLSHKTMFIDDFESCPDNVQETLLRVMSVPEGEPAPFRPVGGLKDIETNVWPIFATNRDVTSFVRPDFLYRFGARIIWLLPLADRPADFAPIAHAIWAGIWVKRPGDSRREPLRSAAVKHLYGKELNWEGNVRSLAALLKLVAAEMCEPSMNGWSQTEIIDEITARGPRILDWVAGYGARSTGASGGDETGDPPAALGPASPVAGRAGVSDEAGLKKQLLQALQPRAASLVEALDKVLRARVRDNGKPRNDPGRHLFYAALLYLAQKAPPHEARSGDLKSDLGIGKGQLQKLCTEMTGLFQGPLTGLCRCEGGDKMRFRFEMPHAVVR